MEVRLKKIDINWRNIADVARTTIGLPEGDKEVPSSYKRRLLMCEHSPIRLARVQWKWMSLPYWVSVHIVRHWLGVSHWVSTQRSDRKEDIVPRDQIVQGAPVIHEMEMNAQAMINISRKRLCMLASPETRQAWKMGLDTIKEAEPELYSVCVKECIYRGFCPEFKTCGYSNSINYTNELFEYRKGINK